MRQVTIHEAKTQLSKPIDAETRSAHRRTGVLAGSFRTPQDFDHMGATRIEALFGARRGPDAA